MNKVTHQVSLHIVVRTFKEVLSSTHVVTHCSNDDKEGLIKHVEKIASEWNEFGSDNSYKTDPLVEALKKFYGPCTPKFEAVVKPDIEHRY